MSSPCELITVWCPCGAVYNDWYRASMNLSLDDFDEKHVDRMSSTTCPRCGLETRLGSLLSHFEDGLCNLKVRAVPKPATPRIVLHRSRPLSDQAKAAARVKDWIKAKGQDGIAEIFQVLGETQTSYYLDPLSEIAARWMIETQPPHKVSE